jgi:superkiller protein 3
MFYKTSIKIFLSVAIIFSINFSGISLLAQDLVPSDDISGGSSIFVFRKSRKAPQTKLSAGKSFMMSRINNKYLPRKRAVAAKRRTTARTGRNGTVLAKNRTARKPAVNKVKLSETLTAQGETHLKNKQFDQAIQAFQKALAQNPKNAEAKDGLSEAYTEKGIAAAGEKNDESAIPLFNEAIKADDKNAVAYMHLGEIHEAYERNDKAIENYEKALAIAPELTELYIPVGLLLIESGEIARAGAYLEKAEKANVSGAEIHYLRGLYLYKQNKNEEALKAFNKTLELDPKSVLAHYYQAVIFDRLNQNQQSIAAYQKSVEIEPNFTPGWHDLGVAYYNSEQYDKAGAAYQKVVAIDNENAEAHANLASVYRQQERYAEANAEYKVAAVKIKNDPDLYSEWGFCLGKVNEWSKAIERLQTAKDLSPDAVDYTNLGWGYYNAAKVAEESKNQAQADAQYEQGKIALQKAVELNPRLAAAQYNLGTTLNALDEFQLALSALNAAVNLKSDWALAINELGVSYRGLKNFESAARQFNAAINLDGKFAPALYNLGELEFARGNKKEAKRIQARLNQLNPALAQKLDNVIAGKIVDETKRQIRRKIPKIPGLPF